MSLNSKSVTKRAMCPDPLVQEMNGRIECQEIMGSWHKECTLINSEAHSLFAISTSMAASQN